MQLFDSTCFDCSKVISQAYSTSFTLGIKALHKRFRGPVFSIYGFVRFADEIVDSFHEFDKKKLLERFRQDAFQAISDGISLNPVLHSFQKTVNEYKIDHSHIEAFFKSMEMDLFPQEYTDGIYQQYIFGSAEVVGLMCLHVFCEGNKNLYKRLEEPARKLGSAFQKVNFLRDFKSDYVERGRVYVPEVDINHFTQSVKCQIEEDIMQDFKSAYKGILQLPLGARQGVYLAYMYYLELFKIIRQCPPSQLLEKRIRVADTKKLALLTLSYMRYSFNQL